MGNSSYYKQSMKSIATEVQPNWFKHYETIRWCYILLWNLNEIILLQKHITRTIFIQLIYFVQQNLLTCNTSYLLFIFRYTYIVYPDFFRFGLSSQFLIVIKRTFNYSQNQIVNSYSSISFHSYQIFTWVS